MEHRKFGILVSFGDEYIAKYDKTYFCITNESGKKLIMSYKFRDIEAVKERCSELLNQTIYYSTWKRSTWSEYEWFQAVYGEREAIGDAP